MSRSDRWSCVLACHNGAGRYYPRLRAGDDLLDGLFRRSRPRLRGTDDPAPDPDMTQPAPADVHQPPPMDAPASPPADVPPSPPSSPSRAGYIPPAPPIPAGYGYGPAGDMVASPGMYLDQESGLTLPQGVQLASVGRRIGAYRGLLTLE